MASPHGSGHIIAAYDFSPTSEQALRHAIEAARSSPSHVLHVITAIDHREGIAIAPTHEVTADYVERIRRLLTSRVTDMLAASTSGTAIQLAIHVPVGQAAAEILRLAHQLDASAVFIGTHGRTDAERIRLGSVSERVVREARCPVTVARKSQPTRAP